MRSRDLLADDAEAWEEYLTGDPYTRSLIVVNVSKLQNA